MVLLPAGLHSARPPLGTGRAEERPGGGDEDLPSLVCPANSHPAHTGSSLPPSQSPRGPSCLILQGGVVTCPRLHSPHQATLQGQVVFLPFPNRTEHTGLMGALAAPGSQTGNQKVL